MALHGTFEVWFGGSGLEVELCVERIQLEIIAVGLARRGTWTAIADLAKVVASLQRSGGKLFLFFYSLGQFSRVGREVVEHPVHPGTCGRIRIVHDEREALGRRGRLLPAQRRGNVRSVACELLRNRFAVGKGGVRNLERHSPSFHLTK